MRPTRIYLARHGETAWNANRIFRGRADVELNARGHAQAQALAGALAGVDLHAIISSPLGRARATAEPVAARHPAAGFATEPGLIDIDYGDWQGLDEAEAAEGWPGLFRQWRRDPGRVRCPGGESLAEVKSRAWPVLVAAAAAGGATLLVAHRVVNKLLLLRALGAGPDGFWRVRQDPACLNVLLWDGEQFTVELLNATHHLGPPGAADEPDF